MNETDVAVDKLQSIQQLWIELGRTKLTTPEYKTPMERIRVLSSEYQALVDAINKPDKIQISHHPTEIGLVGISEA